MPGVDCRCRLGLSYETRCPGGRCTQSEFCETTVLEFERLLRHAAEEYARSVGTSPREPEPFPALPQAALSPEAFVGCLVDAAFRCSPNLFHPFGLGLGRGEYSRDQIREWVRQDYQHILCSIRRHALVAANAADYETIWGLLTRVKTEADADPVGNTFFALPQLWIKLGIALGLTREQIVQSRPDSRLQAINEAVLNEVRFSLKLPVSDFIDAIVDPVFHLLWGEALQRRLGLDHESLDFFWAIAGDRWGYETGCAILQSWAGTREAQTALWERFRAEAEARRQWDRFTILAGIVKGG